MALKVKAKEKLQKIGKYAGNYRYVTHRHESILHVLALRLFVKFVIFVFKNSLN